MKFANPQKGTLQPTSQTWISNNSIFHTFLGQFITDIQHKTEPKSYPTHFYAFKDLINLQILLSYTASDRLGILEFKVPNEAALTHLTLGTYPARDPFQHSSTATLKPTLKSPTPGRSSQMLLSQPPLQQWQPMTS